MQMDCQPSFMPSLSFLFLSFFFWGGRGIHSLLQGHPGDFHFIRGCPACKDCFGFSYILCSWDCNATRAELCIAFEYLMQKCYCGQMILYAISLNIRIDFVKEKNNNLVFVDHMKQQYISDIDPYIILFLKHNLSKELSYRLCHYRIAGGQ